VKKNTKRAGASANVTAAADLEERVTATFPFIGELWRIAGRVPKASWVKLPRDLSSNLDHYIYGAPKQ
jgi:hypothetical protein